MLPMSWFFLSEGTRYYSPCREGDAIEDQQLALQMSATAVQHHSKRVGPSYSHPSTCLLIFRNTDGQTSNYVVFLVKLIVQSPLQNQVQFAQKPKITLLAKKISARVMMEFALVADSHWVIASGTLSQRVNLSSNRSVEQIPPQPQRRGRQLSWNENKGRHLSWLFVRGMLFGSCQVTLSFLSQSRLIVQNLVPYSLWQLLMWTQSSLSE